MRLSSRMPDLAALDGLLAVAHAGSLNAAAREVGISQQAMSARIRALEAQVGVPLLARTSKGSTLTPQGAVIAEWAVRVLDAAHELDVGLAALRAERRGRLRLSASMTVAELLLPRWLASFQAAAQARGDKPVDITLTAVNSSVVVDHLRAGAADLGFIETPSVPSGLRSRVVARDELVLVVCPDHPLARRRRPVGAAELNRTALVSREEGSGTREALAAALRAALGDQQPPPAPILALSSTAAIRGAVLAGAGPAVLSELAVADDLASRRLVRIPVTGIDLHRYLRAVWIGSAAPPAGAVRDLVGHICRAT
jgi:DNA-binding transcriptional LysR family regulator